MKTKKRTRKALAGLTMLIAAGAGSTALAPAALALTERQIVAQCESKVASCQAVNTKVLGAPYLGAAEKVSDTVTNNSSQTAQYTISWAQTTTVTQGVTTTVTVGGTIKELLNVSIAASYKQDWTHTDTKTKTVGISVAPEKKVWLERRDVVQRITADLKATYTDWVAGGTVHYVNGQEYVGPAI